MLSVKTETLQQLENKLRDKLLTEADEQQYNRIAAKYTSILNNIVEGYHLQERQDILEQVRDVMRKSLIREFLLENEAIASIERILRMARN